MSMIDYFKNLNRSPYHVHISNLMKKGDLYTAKKCNIEALDHLLEKYKLNQDALNIALKRAVEYYNMHETVKLAVEKGADVNYRDKYNHILIYSDTEDAKYLLSQGSDPYLMVSVIIIIPDL